MRPGAKYAVIYRHRNEYPISVMCCFFQVSRSGYYDFVHRLGRPEKDAALAEIIAEQRERSFRTYGYRRMWLVLEKQGIHRNPKTILRIMEKYNLLAEIRRRRKWVNMGQQVHKYENLLNRRFHADRPNSKWVTDISYIHTKQGVLYLSMIRGLYDNSIVAYKTGTQQTVNLVLDTIRLAMKREKKRAAAELHLHSDQGFQYTSQAYFNLTQAYGITPSMSRKGNPYDNAMAENFFSILKTECIYRHKPATFSEANEMIDRYIHFYNHERIQLKDWRGAACAAPLHLKLHISLPRRLFVLSAQVGAVHSGPAAFLCILFGLFYFLGFAPARFSHSTHSGPAMQMELYTPETMPMIRGNEKVKMLSSPKTTLTTHTVPSASNVVSVVLMVRVRLWLMPVFTSWAKSVCFLFTIEPFSRMRS